MTVIMQIVAPFTPQEQEFLSDIITTAVEGGIGYWSQVDSYEWSPLDLDQADWKPTTVVVYDTEEDGENAEPMPLDIAKVAEGINRLVQGWPDTVVTKDTLSGLATLDAGEIDSCAADAIVQCALLGEMVYG